jgi:hypothetical protein
MLSPTAIILLTASLPSGSCTAVELIATMTDKSASWDARCAAEDSLDSLPPPTVLQGLLPHISMGMPDGVIWNGGGRVLDSGAPVEWQVFYAVLRSWDKAVNAMPRDTAGTLLLSLLRQSETTAARTRILQDLTHRWVRDAETPAAELMKSPGEDLTLRTTAAAALIQNGEKDYHDLFVEYAKRGNFAERQRWFTVLSDPRHRWRKGMDPEVVEIGFNLILENRRNSPNYVHGSYFLAIQTGDYIREEFRPDQRDPQYQGKHGLTDQFFADTVTNAIRWWTQNRVEIEKLNPKTDSRESIEVRDSAPAVP